MNCKRGGRAECGDKDLKELKYQWILRYFVLFFTILYLFFSKSRGMSRMKFKNRGCSIWWGQAGSAWMGMGEERREINPGVSSEPSYPISFETPFS